MTSFTGISSSSSSRKRRLIEQNEIATTERSGKHTVMKCSEKYSFFIISTSEINIYNSVLEAFTQSQDSFCASRKLWQPTPITVT